MAACDAAPGCKVKTHDPASTCLATVETYDKRLFLASKFSGTDKLPAWIAGYGNGIADLNTCMVFGPKGEVVIPGQGCHAQRPALCSIPRPPKCQSIPVI